MERCAIIKITVEKRNLLLNLQRKFKDGGYALVSEKNGRVFAYAETIKKLYQKIEEKNVKDENKTVVYVPSAKVKHVF